MTNFSIMALQQIASVKGIRCKALASFRRSGLRAVLSLLPGIDWTEFPITAGTISYTETPSDTDAGVFYKSDLQFSGVVDSMEKQVSHNQLEGYDCIFLIRYNTGEEKIIGTPAFPARILITQSTEKNSVFNYKISCQSIYKAHFL